MQEVVSSAVVEERKTIEREAGKWNAVKDAKGVVYVGSFGSPSSLRGQLSQQAGLQDGGRTQNDRLEAHRQQDNRPTTPKRTRTDCQEIRRPFKCGQTDSRQPKGRRRKGKARGEPELTS